MTIMPTSPWFLCLGLVAGESRGHLRPWEAETCRRCAEAALVRSGSSADVSEKGGAATDRRQSQRDGERWKEMQRDVESEDIELDSMTSKKVGEQLLEVLHY